MRFLNLCRHTFDATNILHQYSFCKVHSTISPLLLCVCVMGRGVVKQAASINFSLFCSFTFFYSLSLCVCMCVCVCVCVYADI